MKEIITPLEAARLDGSSGVLVADLMDRAGAAVALEAGRLGIGYGSRVVALAGVGNNGGDAYAAARHLRARGAFVRIHQLGPPRTAEAAAACEAAREKGAVIEPFAGPVAADLVVDGLFGGGFRPGLPSAVGDWIKSRPRLLAIDIPSGVNPSDGSVTGQAFVAERTVTFDYRKTGHVLGVGPDHCGDLVVAAIGLGPAHPELLLTEEVDAPLPRRARTAHKWSAGSVLVVGGAHGMTGAVILAGRAALAFGAGAVGIAVPDDAAAVAAANAPELLHYSFEALPDRFDTLVIGPGLGRDQESSARKVIEAWEGSLVVDADALPLIANGHRARLVVTPHAGEFERMTAVAPSPGAAARLARDLKGVVVLKGNPTIVTDGGTPWLIDRGGPELATIGTGDVLAGMIGALLAADVDPLTAARSACFWHGVAAAALAERTTVTADQLASEIGRYR